MSLFPGLLLFCFPGPSPSDIARTPANSLFNLALGGSFLVRLSCSCHCVGCLPRCLRRAVVVVALVVCVFVNVVVVVCVVVVVAVVAAVVVVVDPAAALC